MVVKVATKPEFFVAKEKMLVELVTISVAISRPAEKLIVTLRFNATTFFYIKAPSY